MPTPNERKGLWFLALVALCGTGVRVWRARQPGPVVAERAALERQIGRVDSVRAGRHEKKEAGRAGVLMDINRAGLAEIEVSLESVPRSRSASSLTGIRPGNSPTWRRFVRCAASGRHWPNGCVRW